MCCPTNKAIQICFFDPKIYVYAVKNIGWDVSENVLGHLNVYLAVFPKKLTDIQ